MKSDIRHFRDLEVYRRAFTAAIRIYVLTKGFPPEERFSLVDQIRRASASFSFMTYEAGRQRKLLT